LKLFFSVFNLFKVFFLPNLCPGKE
jgi:hypothetical protein